MNETEYEAKIPELIKKYKKAAHGIIPEDKLTLWNKIIPIRLKDIYHGIELDEWLIMIKILNNNSPKEEQFKAVNKIFSNLGYSRVFGELILSGLRTFHPNGEECAKYIENIFNVF